MSREKGGSGFHIIGGRLRELFTRKEITTHNLDEFAQLLAQYPNSLDEEMRQALGQEGLVVFEGAPSFWVKVDLSLVSDEFRLVYHPESGKQIRYQEYNPDYASSKHKAEFTRSVSDRYQRQVDESRDIGLKLSDVENRLSAAVAQGEVREVIARTMERNAVLYEMGHLNAIQAVEGLVSAYVTARSRGSQLRDLIYEIFEAKGSSVNLLIDFGRINEKIGVINELLERQDAPAPWKSPETS